MKKNCNITVCTFILLVLLFIGCKEENTTTSLPGSVPELEGVSSQGIIDFLDAAAASRHEFHSFIFLRHGKVIAEGWWNPYRPELRHTLYSTSKSFTATTVGFAVSEKRLSVNDRVISFFPEELPDTVSSFLSELKVKDLLTMSAGQDPDPTFKIATQDSDWVKAFLSLSIKNKPGTKFLYNSLATYMLSAIVQKVTGEKVIDYLQPRLFTPLAIEGVDWETDPRGINTGGWGLRVKTEDMARFGQLFLQKGRWNGKQVLPSKWVEEATTKKIDQNPNSTQSARDSSDWLQGYCYQMWRCRHNAFRADGAYGQYIIVMPEKDAVIAVTAETNNMQDELNLIWDYLLPAIKADKLPENKELSATLNKKLLSLALPLPAAGKAPDIASQVSGKTYSLEQNDKHLKSVGFQFTDSVCNVSVTVDTSSYSINFGAGKWISGETNLPGPDLFLAAKSHFKGLPAAKVAGSFGWKDENTLELVLRYIESPHSETITCRFDRNNVSLIIRYSNQFGKHEPEIKGEIKSNQRL